MTTPTPPTSDGATDGAPVGTSEEDAIPGAQMRRLERRFGRTGASIVEWVAVIAGAVVLALIVKVFLFQAFYIPSPSMYPTLKEGDRVLVNKLSYKFHDVNRGDVIVFKFPQDNSTDFIKRLIGMPGDTIQMKQGVLFINGKVVPKKRVADYIETVDGYEHHVPQYEETLPEGKTYRVLDRDPDGALDTTEEFHVPAGHYFMMGDNRDNSDDSRAAVGYVPAENLEGKAEIRFFSTDGSAKVWEVWKWPFAIRYSRILTMVK